MKRLSITLAVIGIFALSMTAIQFNNNIEKSNAYSASRLTQRNFNRIKLGGGSKQISRILGKQTGESSDGSGRRELYFEQKFKKKRIKIMIEIQKVKGKDMVIEKRWVERLR